MFERAVLVTDLTSGGIILGECAPGLWDLGVREVIVAEAVSATVGMSLAFSYYAGTAESQLERERKKLAERGFVVDNEILSGRAGAQVQELAERRDACLVVVGTEHHSIAGEALGFSFTWNIIGHSKIPVLTVPLEEADGPEGPLGVRGGWSSGLLSHVMLPTDFSDDADAAFGVLESDVAPKAAKISLVHVQDSSKIEPHLTDRLQEFNKIDEERLGGLKSRLTERGAAHVETSLLYGRPVSEILGFAANNGVTLMVLGRKGRGVLAEAFVGSVSHNVLRKTDVPMLLVPSH